MPPEKKLFVKVCQVLRDLLLLIFPQVYLNGFNFVASSVLKVSDFPFSKMKSQKPPAKKHRELTKLKRRSNKLRVNHVEVDCSRDFIFRSQPPAAVSACGGGHFRYQFHRFFCAGSYERVAAFSSFEGKSFFLYSFLQSSRKPLAEINGSLGSRARKNFLGSSAPKGALELFRNLIRKGFS